MLGRLYLGCNCEEGILHTISVYSDKVYVLLYITSVSVLHLQPQTESTAGDNLSM